MENIKAKGTYHLVQRDINGNIKSERNIDNIITNAGLAEIANCIGSVSTPAAFIYVACGTGTTAAAASQTALVAEITDTGLARHTATATRITTTVTNDTLQLTYTFTVTGSKTIEEVGVFNASSSGVMLSRALTGTLDVVNGDEFTITYKIKFA